MIAFTQRGRVWRALCALFLLALVSCTTGSNNNPDENLPGTAPAIFGLTKSSVNAGDTLSIVGGNFGTTQGNGNVSLGIISFIVNSWSENKIDVTVPSGASSGIVVVTKDGRSSQSGQEAQLYIGSIPSAAPVILNVSPDAARAGQQDISIIGTGLGAAAGSHVFFNGPGGPVEGTVVTNAATGEPAWTATNIRVQVPLTAISGAVYVQTANGASNNFTLEVLPPQVD
jgi:hypothetical protein